MKDLKEYDIVMHLQKLGKEFERSKGRLEVIEIFGTEEQITEEQKEHQSIIKEIDYYKQQLKLF